MLAFHQKMALHYFLCFPIVHLFANFLKPPFCKKRSRASEAIGLWWSAACSIGHCDHCCGGQFLARRVPTLLLMRPNDIIPVKGLAKTRCQPPGCTLTVFYDSTFCSPPARPIMDYKTPGD